MNMNRIWTPPDNAKILPDLYNVLDAHAARKTSNINGMLDYHLTTQRNVISKNRHLAERIHREERERVTNALSQIRDKLPAVERIRDFDIKFFKNKTLPDPLPHRRSKGNKSYDKSDDLICRRCYNHHFAIQKNQLANSFTLPSIPRNRRPLPNSFTAKTTQQQQQQQTQNENETENQINPNPTDKDNDNNGFLPESEIPNFLSSLENNSPADVDESRVGGSSSYAPPQSPTKQAFGWWMPCSKTYQFLQKDSVGREIDVNQHYTPRLMPYEDWKNVVRDVCAHCARPGDCVASRQPRGSIDMSTNTKSPRRRSKSKSKPGLQ